MSATDEMNTIQKMEWAHQTILSLYPANSEPESPGGSDADFREQVEVILKDLRYRIARWGMPRAVAFLLARAAFPKRNPNAKNMANRWVLRVLLSPGPTEDLSQYCMWISGDRELNPRMIENMIEGIGWLSNYSVSVRLIRESTHS